MASGSKSKDTLSGEHILDYEYMKAAFNQEVGFVILDKKCHSRVIHRKKDIETIISDIKQGRVLYKKYYTDICNVVNDNGQEILCQVITRPNNKMIDILKIKQILCLEDIFNVLFELHMLKPHLNEAEILEHLSNCIIISFFIHLFQKCCETCSAIFTKTIDVKYRLVSEITILKMVSSDGTFIDILLYIERNTNFVLLRPLKSLTCDEVAYELLNIFADFGPATFLDSDVFRKGLQYKNILKVLKSLDPPFNIPKMYAVTKNHKMKIMTEKAKTMLQQWTENTGSSNWAIGAHVVQWLMNTNKVEDTYIRSKVVRGLLQSPYHALFGFLPRTDLVKIKNKRQSGTLSNKKVLMDCSQCGLPIYKIFKCSFCKRLCHFSCCDRYVEETSDGAIFVNRCILCANYSMHIDGEIILGT